MSPACGSMRIPIIRTMTILRPVKRNFARATAARKASTIAAATVTETRMRLFFTLDQKYVSKSIETFGKHVLPKFDSDPVHSTTRNREKQLKARAA